MTVSSNQYFTILGSLCNMLCRLTAVAAYLLSRFFAPLRGGALRSAPCFGDWSWAFGGLRSRNDLAGLQAYYTVDHRRAHRNAANEKRPSKLGVLQEARSFSGDMALDQRARLHQLFSLQA